MNSLATLQNDCNTISRANKLSILSENQFNILIAGESEAGITRLGNVVKAAASGNPDALAIFSTWHYASRLADGLIANNIQNVNKAVAKRMVDQHGRNAVAFNVQGMVDKDPTCVRQLQQWVHEACQALANKTQAPTQSAQSEQAAHPATSSTQAPQFSSVPPPKGVQTGQARMDPQSPPSARESPQQGSNVHQFRQPSQSHQEPQRTRDDDRTRYRPTDSRQTVTSNQDSPRTYDQHNCFGKDVAVQFQNLPARPEREGAPPPYNTVMLKIAKAKGATCLSGVAWDSAILINLEPHEVQGCLAVLMGFGSKVRYAGHGGNNDKWFDLEETSGDWKGAIRLNVGQGNEKRGINIGPTDVGEVTALFQRALITQQRVSESMMMMNIKRAYALHMASEEAKEARKGGGGQRPQRQAGAR